VLRGSSGVCRQGVFASALRRLFKMIGIRIVSPAAAARDAPLPVVFGEAGGAIGRSVECALMLSDPERSISRKQLLVSYRDGVHFVRQVGTHLEVQLDGKVLPLNVDCPLHDGAKISIGPYVLQATAMPAQPASPQVDVVLGDTNVRRPGRRRRASDVDPAAAAEAAQARAAQLEMLFAALYRGLGVPMPPPAERTVEQLTLIGSLLRRSIAGTLALLAARTIAKRELGASRTQIRTRENNPLKFSPDADVALNHLLGPPRRGFLAPLPAVTEAFDDLRAHEVALLTGMRAALDEVLSQFNPDTLEGRLAPRGVWESLLPAARKAKLWETYGEQYAQIVREIEGDFDSMFGRAFLQAYEKQLLQLGRPPTQEPPE
jgi:FHA domain-containing protein